ncbi:MAG TPA: phosphodiester glycosidase family protein [Candidatus Baltobacteraceae bacterium]|nr:phosphodiester glycosidase family protein [Candidatus Baltobacteraceae bacterium]
MALAAILLSALLPLAPQPNAPFPKVLTDAPTISDVAPGIQYGRYDMVTEDGPLEVHAVAVDLREPSIRIGTALADERLISQGETLSSMARRTGAVAGINGDYFDINQTNQPLNVLVERSRFVRAPMQRWAIAIMPGRRIEFHEFHYMAAAQLPTGTVELKTMNDWPPPGAGAVLMTPEYGPLHPADNVTEIALQPLQGTPPFAQYRVAQIADNTAAQPPGYYLAIGANSYGQADPPNPGDAVTITDRSDPPIDGIESAIGGGPLLVQDGAWYADPDGPSTGEFATHMPASAVALTRDGTLLLLEIDGRQPELSIGVLQPQLAALAIAFGAQTAMQFDGGGSSTIVARLPGDEGAQVQNSPSDGKERRIADALLIFSDAPRGPAARLYAVPQEIRAVPGARVPLHVAITDEGGHPADCGCRIAMRVQPAAAGTIERNEFVAGSRPADAQLIVDAGRLHARVPVRVTADAARVRILPLHPAVPETQTLQLTAQAFDAAGYPIALPQSLPWSAAGGEIDSKGEFRAAHDDATVRVRIGDLTVTQRVTVGEHAADIDFAGNAVFSTAPHGQPGGIRKDDPCAGCLTLQYDFTGSERAAYADVSLQLPAPALALSADVDGDGHGEILRVAIDNAIRERFLYTLAVVGWHGWKHVELRLPDALAQPLTLRALYAINRVGAGAAVTDAGSIALRNVRVVLAGRSNEAPK